MFKVIPVTTGATLVDELVVDELVGTLVVDELVLADELLVVEDDGSDDCVVDVLETSLLVGNVEVEMLEWPLDSWDVPLGLPQSQPARAPIVIQPSTNIFNDCFINILSNFSKPYAFNHTYMRL